MTTETTQQPDVQPGADGVEPSKGLATEPNKPGAMDAPVAKTKEEINAIVESRVAETKASVMRQMTEKYGDLDALFTKAKEFDALKENELSELQKAQRDLEKATGDLMALRPKLDRLEKLETFVKAHVDSRMETLPDPIKVLLADRDPLDAYEFITKHADELAATGARKQTAPPMNGADGTHQGDSGRQITLRKRAKL